MAGSEAQTFAPVPAGKASVGARLLFESPWVWMLFACLLVGVSGLVRTKQDRQFGIVKTSVPPCPLDLEQIPDRIGTWASLPDADIKLDPLTVRITGSTDHIQRTYVDQLTGTTLSVLILYGPAEPVSPHTPEVCYPSTGYTQEAPPEEFKLSLSDKDARFRQAIYSKTGANQSDRAKVYYSFRLGGDWSPDIAYGKKFHRTNAGILKVQIHRVMGRREVSRATDEPVEEFLGVLIPEIETRIAREAVGQVETASR